MPRMIRLPSPSPAYELAWANQYTRMLENENAQLWTAIQNLQVFALPNYTTVDKNALVDPLVGQMVFDTDLDKACVFCSGGWETITST